MTKEERKGGRGGLCRPMGERYHMSRTKIYGIWTAMVSRCIKVNNKNYINYGARGITMSELWANDFIAFYNWAVDNGYEEGDSIIRNDITGGYGADNCHIQKKASRAVKPVSKPIFKTNVVPIKREAKAEIKKPPKERKPRYSITTSYPNRHPLYTVWWGVKSRCYNPNHESYKYYGGKGIYMCEEWKNNFQTFYNWMMENGWEQGITIDRKNNDKPYEPNNCQLITNSLNQTKKLFQMFFSPEGTFDDIAYHKYTDNMREKSKKA